MDRMIYGDFFTAGSDLSTFQVLESKEEFKEGFWKANVALSEGNFVVLDTTKYLAMKKSAGSTSEIPLGFIAEEVVSDNSSYSIHKAMIGDHVSVFKKAIVRLASVEGSIATGNRLILATTAGLVKAKGADTTHPTIGLCLSGNSVSGGSIIAYIDINLNILV